MSSWWNPKLIGNKINGDRPPRVLSLVLRWEELRESGRSISLPELCRDCPELQEEVQRQLDLLGGIAWVDEVAPPPAPGVTTVSGQHETRPGTPSQRTFHPGDMVRDYRLDHLLGQGGFGTVWKAISLGGFPVALKFITCTDTNRPTELDALQRMKAVVHPHLIAIHASWEQDGLTVIAMELAEQSLQERWEGCRRQGLAGIPEAELFRYMREAGIAIDFLNDPHKLPNGDIRPTIVHRDIKPQNLLLLGGSIKVADFGLVRALAHDITSHSGAMTLAYAPPEFFEGKTSRRSDQYSLAVSYCQLRGGQLPFAGINRRRPDLSMLPEGERRTVARALAWSPEKRWSSCGAFVRALTRKGKRSPRATHPRDQSAASRVPEEPLSAPPQPRMADCLGQWRWRDQQGVVHLELKWDGTFTAKADYCVGSPPMFNEWKGTWEVKDSMFVMSQTHFWAFVLWKERPSRWLQSRIREVSDERITFEDGTVFDKD